MLHSLSGFKNLRYQILTCNLYVLFKLYEYIRISIKKLSIRKVVHLSQAMFCSVGSPDTYVLISHLSRGTIIDLEQVGTTFCHLACGR